jgi:predicted small metal-binding protein
VPESIGDPVASRPERDPEGPIAMMLVRCRCGWTARGREERVVEAMQVHGRQIHGLEFTREQVLATAVPGPDRG